jgi:DNA invertase Pin-like site-specific DNA recombinase
VSFEFDIGVLECTNKRRKIKGICDDMKIGYIRVSSIDQNTARQEVLMNDLEVEMMFIDYASGKDTRRPELNRMIDYVREGDIVIVESISRFARNTRDLLNLMKKFTEKGVGFISRKETIDTQTSTGKFMLTVFAAVAELERSYILERQREGIAIAKALGKYNGRPKKDYPGLLELQEMNKKGKITAVAAMK